MKPVILIVEDSPSLAKAFALQLESAGFDSIIVDNGDAALKELHSLKTPISAIILDLNLPDTDGLAMLQARPEIARDWPTIAVTADGSISRAIEAMRLGAFDFLVKPISRARMVTTLQSAISSHHKTPLQGISAGDIKATNGFLGFVGTSAPMKEIYQQIEKVAGSKATVFITGESGTGKEVCADAIHKASPRAQRPFVAINCGAIPENLLESQIFGHLKGAFTGATSDQDGAAQHAHTGTLFLDEICELDLRLQVKLLRFIQTGTVQRLGSTKVQDVDVRIVCATNRDVEAEVEAGRFREDLYYRLAVIPIALPPLRHRGEDIALLANAFLQKFGFEEGKTFDKISKNLERALNAHNWPGNVRELQNFIRRAAVIQDGPDLPTWFAPTRTGAQPLGHPSLVRGYPDPESRNSMPSRADMLAFLKGKTLDEIERAVIDVAIVDAKGSLPLAARALGISPSTLYRKKERWDSGQQSAF